MSTLLLIIAIAITVTGIAWFVYANNEYGVAQLTLQNHLYEADYRELLLKLEVTIEKYQLQRAKAALVVVIGVAFLLILRAT